MTPVRHAFGGAVLLAFLLFLGMAPSARAEWVWDNEVGWIDMNERPAASDRGMYAYAKGLLIRGDYATAVDAFERVERQYPGSPFAGKAKFGRARAEGRLGHAERAAEICGQLLNEKPEGVNIEAVAAYQLQTIRGLTPSSPQRSAELLNTVAGQAPSRKLLHETQMEKGDAEIAAGSYTAAAADYESAMTTAPDADARGNALFGAALADMLASRATGHDETRLRTARDRFQEFTKAARGPKAEQAQEYLWLIDGALAEAAPDRRQAFYDAIAWLADPAHAKGCARFENSAKRYRGTPAGEVSRFYQGECLFRQGTYWTLAPWRWSAFEAYEAFIQEYPSSTRVRTAVEREFAIGKHLAEHEERGRTITVMEAVAHNNPSGPLADDAQMYIGRAELDREHFESAEVAFDAVAQGYPRSEWNSAAVYLGGVARLRHSASANDREMLLSGARRAFEVYVQNAPNGPFADQAAKLLKECRERQAEDLMRIARFYERRHQPQAAAIYFRSVTGEYPDSPLAVVAQSAAERCAGQGGPP